MSSPFLTGDPMARLRALATHPSTPSAMANLWLSADARDVPVAFTVTVTSADEVFTKARAIMDKFAAGAVYDFTVELCEPVLADGHVWDKWIARIIGNVKVVVSDETASSTANDNEI